MIYKYNNKEYKINIITKNIKNIYLRVDEELNINITANKYVKQKDIVSLIENNKNKINKMLESNIEKNDNTIVNYLGKRYDVIYTDNFFEIDDINNKIYVSNKKTLDNFMLKTCKKIFVERLNFCYNMMQKEKIYYPNLKIRKMKTRWGVCNASSKIVTLNYYLIEKTIEEIDYVIVHELSHFVHFNHSASFWALVSKYVPNYKQIRKKMR